ncbi:MAG: DUF2066 domain-containing protein [Alphaproteobacteria bacterium]|nr:DUF2066 domain-containing protein [Alphaproteobacteria bacterium]
MRKFFKQRFYLCILMFLSLPVYGADVFVISDVPVSGEKTATASAKENALNAGKYQAFVDLMDTIVAPADRNKIQVPDLLFVEPFVLDVAVSNEKVGATKYYGALTVRFKGLEVRQFLTGNNVRFLDRLPQPLLIVPVYQNEMGVQLLTDDNPLVVAVRENLPATRLFRFKTMLNDEQDKSLFVSAVNDKDNNAFKALSEKYLTSQLLIVRIEKKATHYAVSTQVWPKGAAPEAEISFNLTDDRESEKRICTDLLKDVVRSMTKKWLYLAQNSAQPVMIYQVFAPVEKISDLSRMKQKLNRLNFAEKIDIKGFSNKRLTVDFHYRGNISELGEKLRMNNLILTSLPDENGELIYLLSEPTDSSDLSQS